jgi:hypothetical protein
MKETIIGEHIRRTNRNRIVLGVLLVGSALFICALNSRYAENFLQGPYSIKREALLAIQNPETVARNFVHIKGDDVQSSGATEVERESGKTVTDYQVMLLDKRLLVVKASAGNTSPDLTGELVPIPDDVREKLIGEIESKEPEVAAAFLPFMLDTHYYRSEGYFPLFIILLFIVVGAWNLNQARKYNEDIKLNPIARTLTRYGNAEDVAYKIDSDFRMGVQKFGKAMVTSAWLLRPTTFNMNVHRLDDLVWIYKKVTRHYHNFIPTGKTYAAILCDRTGASSEIELSESHVDSLLVLVSAKVPWALQGFDKGLAQAWAVSHANVTAAVDERREQLRNAPEN